MHSFPGVCGEPRNDGVCVAVTPEQVQAPVALRMLGYLAAHLAAQPQHRADRLRAGDHHTCRFAWNASTEGWV